MFLAIKKNTLLLYALAFIMIVTAAIIMIFGIGDETDAEGESSASKIIVIDVGHGGPDGGASSGDILEKDLNLAVALKLRDIANSRGCTAVMTRETDDVEMAQSGKYSKKTDLQHRMDVLTSSHGDIFISIHMNKFSDSQYSGAQVFYSDNGNNSKVLGEKIQNSLKNNLDNSNTRAAKGNERNVYILRNATVPAVLVECGFLSNPDELKLLTEDEYQKKLAEAIYAGIEDYINNK